MARDEPSLAVSDHTSVVAFCLARAARLVTDASDPDAVLRRAAGLADGRISRVLASASHRRAQTSAPTVEGLRIGLRVAQDLLDDGEQTIYRAGYWHEEGMLVLSATEPDTRRAAEAAIAELAFVGASAAMQGGRSTSTPVDAADDAILAAIAASVPVAIILAEGAHNQ